MNILIVDDEQRFAETLARTLEKAGYNNVRTASNAEDALSSLKNNPVDLLITDLRMPGMDGLELMAQARRIAPAMLVILMTAFAEVSTARSALKRGALDYLVKPFDKNDLLTLVAQAQAKTIPSGAEQEELQDESPAFFGMIGRSSAMRRVFEKIKQYSPSSASLLILGQSGTGKELVAKAIHAMSERHDGPFKIVHCAAIPENLLESELFGHEKGAFTGADQRKKGYIETAHRGTIFFDEIGELPLSLQPKLLRFLQERQFTRLGGSETVTVDVRVISATNRDIDKETAAGNFREDLLYRLDVARIEMPSLKERREDITPLARHFLRLFGQDKSGLTEDALEALKNHAWPGNIRELQNVIERACMESAAGKIGIDSLPEKIKNPPPGPTLENVLEKPGLDLKTNEIKVIEEALEKARGNKTKAAELLGITRRKLYSRMNLLNMQW